MGHPIAPLQQKTAHRSGRSTALAGKANAYEMMMTGEVRMTSGI
jgi:hypothetical protein